MDPAEDLVLIQVGVMLLRAPLSYLAQSPMGTLLMRLNRALIFPSYIILLASRFCLLIID